MLLGDFFCYDPGFKIYFILIAVISNGISPARNQFDSPEPDKRYDALESIFLTMRPELRFKRFGFTNSHKGVS